MIHPSIAPDIFALRPDFAIVSIVAQGVRNLPSDAHGETMLREACGDLGWAHWAEEHIEAWRAAYRSFGAKPKRTPCSAEALRNRAAAGRPPPAVNAVVDLYNALSLRYAVPIGGEDAASYRGAPRLVRASGGERFDTRADGQARVEAADRGEVVWRDDLGVTCRRWNWRQGVRTRITVDSSDLWFVLERLDPMPVSALLEAGRALIEGLRQLSPQSRADMVFVDASTPPAMPPLG